MTSGSVWRGCPNTLVVYIAVVQYDILVVTAGMTIVLIVFVVVPSAISFALGTICSYHAHP